MLESYLNIFTGESIPKLYTTILETILNKGVEVGPRGMKTKELSPAIMISKNPRKRLFGHLHRRDVSIFTYIEGLWILLGEAIPNRVVHYVKAMSNFVNEKTGEFDGAYGPRLRCLTPVQRVDEMLYGKRVINQFVLCADRLMEDPDTRRAVCVINNPIYDWNPESKDIPCTMTFQFLIRNNKLNMITYMRSQDAWLGLIYDTGEFQWFQEIMAGWLEIDVGTYTHIDGSLHLYEKHWEKARKVIELDSNWDLYKEANILDCRLTKVEYDKQEKELDKWERACRTNDFKKIRTSEDYMYRNDFYFNLLDLIYIYNLRLSGNKKYSNEYIKHNQSDLGLIYRNRWLKEKI